MSDSLPSVAARCLLVASLCFCCCWRGQAQQQVEAEAAGGAEGYFDGTAFAILKSALDIRRMTSLGFRTCSRGLLFHQAGAGGDSLQLELTEGGRLRLSWRAAGSAGALDVGQRLNDNRWHQILLRYALGVVHFTVDNAETEVANATWHSELLGQDLKSPNPEVVVGQGFQGCLLQGAGLVFSDPDVHSAGVNWTLCPLPDRGHCDGYRVDYCFSQPCHKHGTCTSSSEGYQCHCTARYTGRNCETDTGPLCERPDLVACENGGVCQEDKTGNATSCACPLKYTGRSCEHLIDDRLCDTNPCLNNATCHLNRFGDGYECSCVAGFAGTECETDIDECSSSPCQHGGACVDGVASYSCRCLGTGYRGQHCETNIDECAEDEHCFNRGRCFDTYGGYFCQCPPGFAGRNCEKEVNECSSVPCQHGASCQNLLNRYQCICLSGFQGPNCEVNIDNCLGVTCPGPAHCADGIDEFRCVCDDGYSGSPPNCTDIDECATSPCLNGGTCFDRLGHFSCQCPDGFAGSNCEQQVDECASSPCLRGGTCVDSVGSYSCMCPAGLLGPNCSEDIDECVSLPCLNGGRCEDKVGDFECHCPQGWSGKNCEYDADECESAPCQHGGRCEDGVGSYECHCLRSWSGHNCELSVDPCSAAPCLNNGTCKNSGENNFTCECGAGFTGHRCESAVDECLDHPCHNGGTCTDQPGGFHCQCPEEFGGRTCANPYDDCVANPCLHGGTCHSVTPHRRNSTCMCAAGFVGERCETDEDDCPGAIQCPAGEVCVDLPGGFECRCPAGFEGPGCHRPVDACATVRCLRGGTCLGNGTCACATGFGGTTCAEDVDECADNSTYPCRHGLCQNKVGSFQCYCTPGYTGASCDQEYNECLSQPCQNGGECRDLVAKYKCLCLLGFTGTNCETDIDECASQPCLNNGSCVNRVGAFECRCQPGYAGIMCEQDIDECASMPCQHSGVCLDRINGFQCDCADTGFRGDYCEENIDDCLSSPCVNDASCTDLVKNYSCVCHPGFHGRDCQLDVAECAATPCLNGGVCVEKSNRSVYELDDVHRPPGFPLGPYAHSGAGGHVCICPRGFAGANCEINIDDCAAQPCRNGTCVDGIDEFSCRCFRGFEGTLCETEIDECRRHRPCARGATCLDLVGDYHCQCETGIGGKNCTVQLTGCDANDCLNGATCVPYLLPGSDESRHARNCTCATGFSGAKCQFSTTASFDGGVSHKLVVMGNTSLGYDLSLRFRTTMPDGLLAFGYGHARNFLLFLEDGALCLLVERNNQSRLVVGSGLNDGQWRGAWLNLSTWGVQLTTSDFSSQGATTVNRTINFRGTVPIIPNTYVGGKDNWMKPEMDFHVEHIPDFVGCVEDVTLSGGRVVPNVEPLIAGSKGVAYSGEVTAGCPRTEQCFQTTCNGGGACVDLWNAYTCRCWRPHFGLLCEHEYESATFGHENSSQSLAETIIGRRERRELRNNATVSLFVRSRQSEGLIFYLGNGDSLDGAADEDTFLAAEWEAGVVRVSVKINGTPESLVDKTGIRLDNGYYHFLKVSLVNRTLSASVNATTIFKMEVEANKDRYLEARHLYLGGLPVPQQQHFASPGDAEGVPLLLLPRVARAPFFKGIMQDVRLNDWMLDLFDSPEDTPLNDSSHILQGNVTKMNVLRGVQSDNACRSNPCRQGSTCVVTWNDYYCRCEKGFRGKNCTELEFCSFNSCPLNSECRSLSNGFECIANATFNGRNSSIDYVPHLEANISLRSISFHYRSERGGPILKISHSAHFFDVTLSGSGHLKLSWSLSDGTTGGNDSGLQVPIDAQWHSVDIALLGNALTVRVDGEEPVTTSHALASLDALVKAADAQLLVGGSEPEGHYRGCLREVRLGGVLLPFFPRGQLTNDTSASYFEAMTVDNVQPDLCLLCYESECQHGSTCLDPAGVYHCDCSLGYEGQLCEVDVDECEGVICQNGATCVDGIAQYKCQCIPGYEGNLCEHDIDECANSPCFNGATCHDELNSYLCQCTANYTGTHCEKEKPFDCSSHPCSSGATCFNKPPSTQGDAGFECLCPTGRTGVTCDAEIDFCQPHPCFNGATCNNLATSGSYRCHCVGGYEGIGCELLINYCKSNPCANGATCVSYLDGPNCTCAQGFEGEYCTNDTDECETEEGICQHNGTCHNQFGTFDCECPAEYTGHTCELPNMCTNSSCLNGGTCFPMYYGNDTWTNCSCPDGYEGPTCDEEAKPTNSPLNAELLGIVIGSVVAATVLIVAGVLTVFLTMAKKKRATRGTYSPSRQEMFGSRVEMGHVMKPPPEERLI